MRSVSQCRVNPNPITKFFVVGLLGVTVLHPLGAFADWSVVIVISVMYFLNGRPGDGVRNIVVFGILFLAPTFEAAQHFPFVVKIIFSLFFVLRMFYIPFAAGKFMIKTSDVGSIISSMNCLRIPETFSVPVAVMFRFFPSFKEEKSHIKTAMKIRGIRMKNPVRYIEYIAVPLLIISSNIADDISKAAETKCIGNPAKKTRYIKVGVQPVDFIYALAVICIAAGGWLC